MKSLDEFPKKISSWILKEKTSKISYDFLNGLPKKNLNVFPMEISGEIPNESLRNKISQGVVVKYSKNF